jgi:hypothetical protein
MADKKHNFGAMLIGMAPKKPMMDDGAGPKDAGSDEMPLDDAAQELIQAVEAKDAAGVKEALRAAFMFLDSQPHHEGPEEGE